MKAQDTIKSMLQSGEWDTRIQSIMKEMENSNDSEFIKAFRLNFADAIPQLIAMGMKMDINAMYDYTETSAKKVFLVGIYGQHGGSVYNMVHGTLNENISNNDIVACIKTMSRTVVSREREWQELMGEYLAGDANAIRKIIAHGWLISEIVGANDTSTPYDIIAELIKDYINNLS